MDEFVIEFIDKLTDAFKSLADIIRDFQEQWFPNSKSINNSRGKASARAKIAKHKAAPQLTMRKITMLLLDKRTKIHRCRNHCRKYGRQKAIKHQESTTGHSSEVGSFYFGKHRLAVFI